MSIRPHTTTSDPDALARLDPDRVGAYLAANGWEHVPPPDEPSPGMPSCWATPPGVAVWIPDPGRQDAPARWRRLVDTLAELEDRAPVAVLADLAMTPPDPTIAAHPVYRATSRACTQAAADLDQAATELRVAAGTGLPPHEHAVEDLRAAADRLIAAVLANATAAAELIRFDRTTVTADPATTADPPL